MMRQLFASAGLGAFLLLSCLSSRADAYIVKLAWDGNPEFDIAGYRLSYGTRSRQYTTTIDVGPGLDFSVNNLQGGVTYYFAVTAYNTAGDESDYSAEVQFTVPLVYHRDRLTYDAASGVWSQPLQTESGATPASVPGWSVLPGDFNGDGFTDYFLYNRTTGAWMKAVDNREGSYSFYNSVWGPGWSPYIADFNGDGHADVFVYSPSNGHWFRCISAGDGRGDFLYSDGVWAKNWQVFPADLNGDGRDDLFLYNGNGSSDPNSGLWFRVFSTASNDFDYAMGDFRWAPGWQIYPADLNGDRRADLFLYRADGMWFRVIFDKPATTYVNGRWATNWGITPGDFNGDGLKDLFVYNVTTGMWFTVVSVASGATADRVDFSYVGPGAWAPGWTIRATDRNGDTKTDLIAYSPTNGAWFDVITLAPGTFDFAQFVMPTSALVVR